MKPDTKKTNNATTSSNPTQLLNNRFPRLRALKAKLPLQLQNPRALTLILFLIGFAGVGSYLLVFSNAASVTLATIEAETMTLPGSAMIISDSAASGGQAIKFSANGIATGSFSLSAPATSLTVRAKGIQCKDSPGFSVSIDGSPLGSKVVTSSTWTDFGFSRNMSAGTHSISITSTNYGTWKNCTRNLFVDKTSFIGETVTTPTPTVTLAANPMSVSIGGTSTLTWSSTNATNCTASGAWSGTRSIAGNTSTGILGASSIFTLTCTGSGGSATASVVVTGTKADIRGVMDRDKAPDVGYRNFNDAPLVNAYVIKTHWNILQPNNTSELITNVPNPENNNQTLDESIAEATALGMPIRLRIYAGINTPNWVLAQVGSLTWYDPDVPLDTYTIPKFWTTAHRDLWNNFMTKLSERLDSNGTVSQVTMSRCSTVFAEPLIRQAADQRNLDNAVAAGYTQAADLQCQKDSMDIMQTTWRNTRVSFAFNPFQAIDETSCNPTCKIITPVNRLARTKELIDYCRAQLLNRCVLGNNSLRDNATSTNPQNSEYDEMYAHIQSKGSPIYFQTATPAKIGDWAATLQKAIELGANSVELPSGGGGYFNLPYDKATLAAKDALLESIAYPQF